MIVRQWNIRGCNDLLKQKEVRNFIIENKLSIMIFLENKVRKCYAEEIANACCPTWSFFHNCMGEGVGRVWSMWNQSDVEIDLLSIHEQVITVKVKVIGTETEFYLWYICSF